MKAYVLEEDGALNIRDLPTPVPQEKEVLVAVRAAGICGSDIPRIYRSGAYFYPLIPGHEFSGIVEKVGDGVDAGWIGKRVGIFPLIPCGKCTSCNDRHYELCRKYSYMGSRRNGGFAEYVCVPEWNLIELPREVSFEQAAMLEPMAVAVHAIRRANIKEGSTVAVCGLGTIGLLTVLFLMDCGLNNILTIGNKPSQLSAVLNLGIKKSQYCDVLTDDADKWLDEMTAGEGAEVFFDCTGKNEAVEMAIRHTSPLGTSLLVGNPAGDMKLSRQDYWKILRNELTVSGTWNSYFDHNKDDDWHYCLERISDGRIKPELLITHRVSFDDLASALEMMRDKTQNFIKTMMLIDAAL